MAEEEVHGGVEARVQPDEQEDEQVAQHRGQVHAQEQGEEYALLLWPDGEPQEEELGHAALVLPPHSLLTPAGHKGSRKYQSLRYGDCCHRGYITDMCVFVCLFVFCLETASKFRQSAYFPAGIFYLHPSGHGVHEISSGKRDFLSKKTNVNIFIYSTIC